jgi:hypothetical protein
MSTDTATRIDRNAGLRLGRIERVLFRRLISEGWRITRWFWPVAVLVAVVVGAVIAHFTPVTKSIWENAAQWPRWWLFVAAIAIVTSYLPVVVLHGVTRRAALRALGLTGVSVSLMWAAFLCIGQVVERFLYLRLGWPDELDTAHLFSNGYDVLPMFVEYGLILTAYTITGALVGGLYYRFGGIRGTVLLPFGLLPGVATELLLSTGWYSGLYGPMNDGGLDFTRPPLVVLVAAVLAILCLAALAVHLVLRDVAVHSKK